MTVVSTLADPARIDAVELISWSTKDLFSIGGATLEELQKIWTAKRFNELKESLTSLKKLADEQGIDEIKDLNDIVPVLFTHEVYKAYPLSWIEKCNIKNLNRFLDKFTIHDLSGIDVSDCKTIDDWLERLEEHDMWPLHSSGTTGKISVMPRSQTEMDAMRGTWYHMFEDMIGEDMRGKKLPFLFQGFPKGRQVVIKLINHFGPEMASEVDYITLRSGELSADFMSLAGRLRAAQAKGELGKLQLIKSLSKNKGEMIRMKRNRPKLAKQFFEDMMKYRGQKVIFAGLHAQLIQTAVAGIEQGITGLFSPDSLLLGGGGMKGFEPPENWRELLFKFFGVNKFDEVLGMTENIGLLTRCEYDQYHTMPYTVPFVLDKDGNSLPRNGVQIGRYAFVDLLAQSYWGGFITGDKITMHWDDDCECGRKGPYMENNIRRFSEETGDEDKISCSGVAEAYDNFVDFITADEED